MLRFVVSRAGRVLKAWVPRSTLGHLQTERCLLRVLRTIRFADDRGDPCCDSLREVIYPLRFRPRRERWIIELPRRWP